MVFQAVLQAIEIGETLLPTLMPGLDVDVPGTGKNPRLRPPVTCQFERARGTDGGVVVGTDDLTGERQQIRRNRCEVTQRWRAGRTLDIGRRDQQRPAHLTQVLQRRSRRPMGDGDAAEAVRDEDDWRAVGGNRLGERGDPIFTTRRQSVGLLHARTVRQTVLPVALPMIIWRSLPARHNPVAG